MTRCFRKRNAALKRASHGISKLSSYLLLSTVQRKYSLSDPLNRGSKAYSSVNKTERRWRRTRGTPEGWEQNQNYSEYILISQQGITAH